MTKHPNRQGSKRVLTPTQVAEIAAAIARGETKTQLALDYGVGRNTIVRSLRRESTPSEAKKKLKPCGTHAAYVRHLRKGELACEACLEGHKQARLEQIKKDPNHREKRKQWNENYRARQISAKSAEESSK